MNIKQNDGCNCALENGKIPYQAEILSISNFFQLYFLTQQFFFLIYFLVEGKLLYNLVLVSAIQQSKSTIIVYMYICVYIYLTSLWLKQ